MMKFGTQHPETRANTEKKLQGAVTPRGVFIKTYTPDRTFGAYCIYSRILCEYFAYLEYSV